MKRIGLLSDTHGFWDDKYATYFSGCEEIWHAGDIGSLEVAMRLQEIALLRAVCGNIDGGDVRRMFPEILRFRCEEADVLLKHIGGYPGHYDISVRRMLLENPPTIFVAGHSHILKVIYDKQLGCLHLNPGAAGLQGWHKQRTLLRFNVEGKEIKDLEIIELARR